MRPLFLLMLGLILWTTTGCGSAAEFPQSGGALNPASPVSDESPVHIATFAGYVDPVRGIFELAPVSSPDSLNETLGFVSRNESFLALDVGNVTFNGEWNVSSFDTGTNRAWLSEGAGGCLTVSSAYRDLSLYFNLFSDANITLGGGAVSTTGGWRVNFQDVRSSEITCRPFYIQNTTAVAYSFNVKAQAAGTTGLTKGNIFAVTPNDWSKRTDEGRLVVSVTGSEFDTPVENFIKVNDKVIGFFNVNTDTSDLFAAEVIDENIDSPGFLTLSLDGEIVTGPYVTQRAGVFGDFILGSGLPSALTGSLYWSICDDPSPCVLRGGAVCAQSHNRYGSEIRHQISLNSSSATTEFMKGLHFNSDIGGAGVYVVLDIDGNGPSIGDPYVTSPTTPVLQVKKYTQIPGGDLVFSAAQTITSYPATGCPPAP